MGLVLGFTPTARAESDDQLGTPGLVDVELGTAIQAVRGRVVGQAEDAWVVQTTSRELLVHLPAGFSPAVGACIQVSGQVPLGPIFEADQASLAPAEDQAAACHR